MKYENKITYPLFEDGEVTLVEIEDKDDCMHIGEFLGDCIGHCFTDYDGYGYFVKFIDKTPYAITDITFSIDEDKVYYKGEYIGGIFYFCNLLRIDKVVWFNK